MITDYRTIDRDMAVWSETTCKAWIASGAIVPPVVERPRAMGFQIVIWAVLALIPFGFLWGLFT